MFRFGLVKTENRRLVWDILDYRELLSNGRLFIIHICLFDCVDIRESSDGAADKLAAPHKRGCWIESYLDSISLQLKTFFNLTSVYVFSTLMKKEGRIRGKR